tara:strand:+ start:13131 stop:13334 length:204 start_codon:yes stop_codon:yes gene_type:complete
MHAEARLLASGDAVGDTLWLTLAPCVYCAHLVAASTIRRVLYLREYRDPRGVKILRDAGVEVERWTQ